MSTSSQLKHVTKYRPDIDGLRAFAVICVIIFHIWPKALPGGFVGVDIFFVISGFLITTIIMSEMINGTFSFAKFYTRRIKRIMPLCWTIVIIASIAAWLILLPGDLINFSGSARAVGFYASNIFFIKHNNYFAISSNEIPLIHTWSLSVEEQFYLVWPILLFFIYKFTKNLNLLILTIIGIILLSLSFSIWCSHHKLVFGNYGFGYYSIFSRAYELSVGVLLALIFEKRKHSKDILCAINSLNSKFNLISVIGVLLLFYSIFFITDGDQFPGYLALLPTFGAALIILTGTGTHRCIVNRILSHKVIVYIGLLSYSLYLFHWPILAYWHYENPGLTPDISQGIVIIIVTMLLSILGYLLIELPIKKMQLSMLSAIVLLQILPLTLFMTLRNKIYNNDGYIERLDDSFRTKPFFFKEHENSNYFIGGYTQQKPVNVLLIGDSHAEHFAPFWNMVALKYGFSIRFMYYRGCYPLINHINSTYVGDVSGNDRCKQQISNFTNQYKDYNVIILAGRWGYNFGNPQTLLAGEHPNYPSNFNFESEIRYTISTLVAHGHKVIVMGDSPTDNTNNIDLYIRRKLFTQNKISSLFIRSNTLTFDLYDNAKTNNLMENISESYPNTYFFDFNKEVVAIMPTFPLYESYLLYKDFGHLNYRGSEILAEVYLNSSNSNDLKNKLLFWSVIKP